MSAVNKLDLTGCRYGSLLVIRECEPRITPSGGKKRMWECRCDCGKIVVVLQCSLRSGGSKSCGCIRARLLRERSIVHGKRVSRPYSIWSSMKTRCNNPRSENYHYYGGRGIKYDSKWESFSGFWEDMEDGYSDKLSLDRINPDEGYNKKNCRWIDPTEQARNKLKYTNNTSSVTGVSSQGSGKNISWVASWVDLDGKSKSKSFSVGKYGEEAFNLAVKCRETAILTLNELGAGYTDSHGK